MIIYVGDGSNVIKRIRKNHCGGNVEGSTLRQHVATALGYELTRQKRPSGSTRIRIASPTTPKEEEKIVTKYIRNGSWRFVTCDSAQEALDFQWYVIKQLQPILNVNARPWNPDNKNYQDLFDQLMNGPQTAFQNLDVTLAGPGVYVFYHDQRPDSKIHRSNFIRCV